MLINFAMERECDLYKKEERKKGDKSVRCLACSHNCLIANNRVGICGVRKNTGGKLFLLVYGKVVAEHVDSIEKKPLYHFLPGSAAYSIGTIGCNFRCGFCQNFDISQLKEVVGNEEKPEEIVERAIKTKCKSIAYTYNEPTIFVEFVKDIAKIAKKKGLKNILVTNGYESKECMKYLKGHVDAMNIDLKSFSDDFYKRSCGATLKPVLETIKLAHKMKIHVEITTLLIPGENDSEDEIEKIAKFIASVDKNIPWHISRFFPMYKMTNKGPTDIESLRLAEKIGKKYLKHVHVGNV
jgi:pyruvate formate lyase activating enzyme